MERESIITCPICGATKREAMPEDACQFFYECSACGSLLRPREGECCVFCSYGSTPCPPKQLERGAPPPQEDSVACSQPSPSCAQRDLVASRSGLWFWGLPAVLLLVGVFWGGARAPLWSVAFLVGGAACVANAARCGRAHCYLTGPLYLGLAAVSALIGVRIISWSWGWVGAAFLVGTLLAHVPEFLGKRYVHGSSSP